MQIPGFDRILLTANCTKKVRFRKMYHARVSVYYVHVKFAMERSYKK